LDLSAGAEEWSCIEATFRIMTSCPFLVSALRRRVIGRAACLFTLGGLLRSRNARVERLIELVWRELDLAGF